MVPDINQNDCYKYAALRNALNRKGKMIELLVSYDPSFTMMAEWFKQLFGESEGKDNKGLFPASVTFFDRSALLGTVYSGRNTLHV